MCKATGDGGFCLDVALCWATRLSYLLVCSCDSLSRKYALCAQHCLDASLAAKMRPNRSVAQLPQCQPDRSFQVSGET